MVFPLAEKSTMAKDLAREVGYIYIDSGAMYRAVTLYSIENGIFNGDVIDTERLKKEIKDIHISFRLNKETGRPDTYLNGVNVENKIRSMEVSSKVSPISTLDFVREEMVAQQQAMGKEKGHRHGWPGYRNYRFPGCGTGNICNRHSRNPCSTPL